MPISSFSLCKMLPKNVNHEFYLEEVGLPVFGVHSSIYIKRSLNYCNNFNIFIHELY